MSVKSNIKVIKKADAVRKPKKVKEQTSREAAREMVSTVTDWVVELKDRKSDETRAALELLFNTARPSESS
jgi:hypothetical protein